jgi:hypothetical protein
MIRPRLRQTSGRAALQTAQGFLLIDATFFGGLVNPRSSHKIPKTYPAVPCLSGGPTMPRRLIVTNRSSGTIIWIPEANPRFKEIVEVAARELRLTFEKALAVLGGGEELITDGEKRILRMEGE